MDFLNKLYESNYFGIGLFFVISFLVVTFLIVLFFGKKDEQKRKLEKKDKLEPIENLNTFKETSVGIPLEVKEPVMEPVAAPVTPIPMAEKPLEPVAPVQFESIPIEYSNDLIKEEAAPIFNEMPQVAPINEEVVPIIQPTATEPIFSQIVEPTPISIEPVRIQTPEVPVSNSVVANTHIEPIIQETVTPIITEPVTVEPIIEEPIINTETYYQPMQKVEAKPVDVPSIDFDAIAKSISKELDSLEKASVTSQVEVTPIKDLDVQEVVTPAPVKPTIVIPKTKIELPKKIDLPMAKEETNSVEPESYSL